VTTSGWVVPATRAREDARAPGVFERVARVAKVAAQIATSRDGATRSPVLGAHRSREAARDMCRVHAIDVRTLGAPPRAPAVIVANHLGYLDPIVLGSLVSCVAIAKREVRGWPLVGARLASMGVTFVDRNDPWSGARAIRAMIRALRLGTSVLNFPEGTTTEGRYVLPFRGGAFLAACVAGAPIVPARIAYDDARVAWIGDATFLPHYLGLTARGPVRATVTFGAPIRPVTPTRRRYDARDLAEQARAAIEAMRP
jgi:1-acyl-sn-glycerol-3-phosphate acyltransferase